MATNVVPLLFITTAMTKGSLKCPLFSAKSINLAMIDKSEQREIIAEWCEAEATKADKVVATVDRYLAQEWHRWRAGWLRMQAAELRADHD